MKELTTTMMQRTLNKQDGRLTYYRWRKEFGGLKVDQARRLL
jgi:hypothetical protein